MLYGVGIHSQSIRRIEARENGLSFVTDIERSGVASQVEEVFGIYSDILRLEQPFIGAVNAEEWVEDADGRHYLKTPIAIVESIYATNPAYIAFHQRHWNSLPLPAQETPASTPAVYGGTKPVIVWGATRPALPPAAVKV